METPNASLPHLSYNHLSYKLACKLINFLVAHLPSFQLYRFAYDVVIVVFREVIYQGMCYTESRADLLRVVFLRSLSSIPAQ